jgi:hypothetical protein
MTLEDDLSRYGNDSDDEPEDIGFLPNTFKRVEENRSTSCDYGLNPPSLFPTTSKDSDLDKSAISTPAKSIVSMTNVEFMVDGEIWPQAIHMLLIGAKSPEYSNTTVYPELVDGQHPVIKKLDRSSVGDLKTWYERENASTYPIERQWFVAMKLLTSNLVTLIYGSVKAYLKSKYQITLRGPITKYRVQGVITILTWIYNMGSEEFKDTASYELNLLQATGRELPDSYDGLAEFARKINEVSELQFGGEPMIPTRDMQGYAREHHQLYPKTGCKFG